MTTIEQRAALVDLIGDDVEVGTAEAWRIATGQTLTHRDRMIIRRALDVALAAVEAAGWGPRPTPDRDRDQLLHALVRVVMGILDSGVMAESLWQIDEDAYNVVQAAMRRGIVAEKG